MGLLITTCLILINSYSSVQESGPQNRDFGLIEIWMIACQLCVFTAMIEYSIILSKMKDVHDQHCKSTKKKLRASKVCCKSQDFNVWDFWCFIVLMIFFLLFNTVFWSVVAGLKKVSF